MNEFTLVMSLTAVLFSALTVIFSIASYAKVVGMEKSTHKVQMVPVGNGLTGEDLTKKMKETLYPDDEDEYI